MITSHFLSSERIISSLTLTEAKHRKPTCSAHAGKFKCVSQLVGCASFGWFASGCRASADRLAVSVPILSVIN